MSQPTTNVKDNLPKTISWHLPFTDVESTPLTNINIGKLFFLTEGTVVTVTTPRKTASCEENGSLCNCKWRLLFQRSSKEPDKVDFAKTPDSKPLMCAMCFRSFDTVSSIQTHVDALHDTNQPDWKTTPLAVMYQDDSLAVINKPQGIAVMGSDKETSSLSRSNLFLALASHHEDALRKPIAIHRLDASTGGLLVIAKTKSAERYLKDCLVTNQCRKHYRAICVGKLQPLQGTITKTISNKQAKTTWCVVQHVATRQGGYMTVVDLFPTTGRKHQLRRHLKFLGHAIWGDVRYGGREAKNAAMSTTTTTTLPPKVLLEQNLTLASAVEMVKQNPYAYMCLWAVEIAFPHPQTGEELVVSLQQEPLWFQALLQYQQQPE